ncbi:ABC transporter ATP-binding protein [Gulosibacter molinativorax]|uniref:ABC transporter ATP-binding protein n=1 Tax=Gulosibacter molinativorax TaxID=256821 RepID=A0ABT7C4J9_9MICO|nr:ABC transporter ATP-binding protein [Gulosibacter molinativorax]MDJ1369960.1 ABC transporter ATP-binding protein [Gulosibacter molinativorax]QUY63851.1 ABC transporter ATP-binding protein YvfR [Gulosibacter molinativorax]
MNTPVVQVTSVEKAFNGTGPNPVHAVAGVDLTIHRGEIIALLGSNGAGKTTLLDMILGLTTPTKGEISLFGASPGDAVAAGQIAAVLQSGGLLGDLTVGETVRMISHLYPHSLAPEEAMKRAGIRELANRRVSKCSGGEQQRLRFALALLPEPELLVLDEPTAGMDVNARRDFWATMSKEARDGRTIIFATHYLQEADDFAERIVMVHHGVIVADGPVAQIRALTGRKHVSVEWPDASDADLAGIPGTEELKRSGSRIQFVTSDSDTAARFLLNTSARNLEITAAGLDSVFTNLTTEEARS